MSASSSAAPAREPAAPAARSLLTSPALKRADLIVNPISGQGASLRAADLATRILAQSGIRVVRHTTTAAGEGQAFAAALDPECDLVVAVGGDGTLNEIVSGLRRQVTIGLVPVGTANVVARDVGIPLGARRAAEMLIHATGQLIDVGMVNDRRFLAMVGVGFDAAIVHAIARARHGPISKITYVGPSLGALRDFRASRVRVTVDGVVTEGDLWGAIIANTRNYGGYFAVAPRARIDDGILHWVGHRAPGRLAMLRTFAAAAFRRELGPGSAVYGAGREFRIEAIGGERVPVQADGDDFGFLPITIRMLPGAATLLCPRREATP